MNFLTTTPMQITMANRTKKHDQQAEAEPPLHGDVLESILTHVPLLHLLPAFQVSKSWKRAVSNSLRHFNKIKPWLLLHSQATRPPYSTTTHAYDPRSNVWIEIHQPPVEYISTLRSSHSTLLYMLSLSKFSFSFDPLHLDWHHIEAPLMWRTDPVVAMVGRHVIIAGGTCDFEDDPLAVEMYDLETKKWNTCQSMPAVFKDSAASTWLSIAVKSNKMYVKERSSGVAYLFDPNTKSWHGPCNINPDQNVSVSSSLIGFTNNRLILIGLIGDNEKVKSVKLWELDDDSLEFVREIGEMPKHLVAKLKGEVPGLSYIAVNFMGDFVYINNTSAPGEVFLCELGGDGGACNWSSVKNVTVDETTTLTKRLVFTCANVRLRDLHGAMVRESIKFTLKGYARD